MTQKKFKIKRKRVLRTNILNTRIKTNFNKKNLGFTVLDLTL